MNICEKLMFRCCPVRRPATKRAKVTSKLHGLHPNWRSKSTPPVPPNTPDDGDFFHTGSDTRQNHSRTSSTTSFTGSNSGNSLPPSTNSVGDTEAGEIMGGISDSSDSNERMTLSSVNTKPVRYYSTGLGFSNKKVRVSYF